MSDNIYLIRDRKLVELTEEPYDSEELLQKLLANYPNLLAGSQIDLDSPRRWLLVSRELGVPGEEGGQERWALDHLFLDQDGIPTLVEVKRSTNTQIRRQVVGQMLDYAANAIAYWPIEDIRNRFVSRCEHEGIDSDDALLKFLENGEDLGEFWSKVKTNLQAGKIRLLFVADAIPAELRQIVEFLNWQMDPAEVLALEIKQYVGEGLQTLVPRVIGQSADAQRRRSVGSRPARLWDEPLFFEKIAEQCRAEVQDVARRIYDWTKQRLDIRWGKGKFDGSFHGIERTTQRAILYGWTSGSVQIPFGDYAKYPPFDDQNEIKAIFSQINELDGIQLGEKALTGWPTINMERLTHGDNLSKFLNVLEVVISRVREPSA